MCWESDFYPFLSQPILISHNTEKSMNKTNFECKPVSHKFSRHRTSTFVCAATSAVGVILNLSMLAAAAEGDWPMWRHDTQLSGYQPLPGAMSSAPRVLAK